MGLDSRCPGYTVQSGRRPIGPSANPRTVDFGLRLVEKGRWSAELLVEKWSVLGGKEARVPYVSEGLSDYRCNRGAVDIIAPFPVAMSSEGIGQNTSVHFSCCG